MNRYTEIEECNHSESNMNYTKVGKQYSVECRICHFIRKPTEKEIQYYFEYNKDPYEKTFQFNKTINFHNLGLNLIMISYFITQKLIEKTQSTRKIKVCPFCASIPQMIVYCYPHDKNLKKFGCFSQFCSFKPQISGTNKKTLIYRWNTRWM